MADSRPLRVPTGPAPHSLEEWPARPTVHPWRIAPEDRLIEGVDISAFFSDLWQKCTAVHPLPADADPLRLAVHVTTLQLAQLGNAAHQRQDDVTLWQTLQRLKVMRQLVTAGGPHLLGELAQLRAATGEDYRCLHGER